MTIEHEFEQFWAKYPKKIGRLVAERAYRKARKTVTAATLLDGLSTFLAHLDPDPQFWPRASTWLNQGRWDDDYTVPAAPPAFGTSRQTQGNVAALQRFAARHRSKDEPT